MSSSNFTRRNFISKTTGAAVMAAGLTSLSMTKDLAQPTTNERINYIGPKDGYTPQIGTLVSMMNWMRQTILWPVEGLSVAELDYLHDDNSNSIGGMLLHLAATERFYQLNPFEGREWGDWPKKDADEFDIGMSLGDEGRSKIKGNNLEFYLEKLNRVREYSLQELAKRDDD